MLKFSFLAAVVAATSLSAQALLTTQFGPYPGTAYGRFVSRAGDVDRDGVPDYAVGAPKEADGAGVLRIYSGESGKLLFRIVGDSVQKEQLGSSVGPAGDVNNDGYPDVIAGASSHPRHGILTGAAHVFSGKDGTLLHTVYGHGKGDLLGHTVAGVGDLDGDGFDEFAAGAPENGDPVASYGNGYAEVFSGKTGRSVARFDGLFYGGEFGIVVLGPGDVDGDGTPDIMAGSTLEYQGRGSVRVFSGRTKQILYSFPGIGGGDHFGMVNAVVGDVDNDGRPDLLFGAPNPFSGIPGAVWVYSGRTGTLLHHIEGSATSGMFGMCVLGLGDVNLDGHADFAVGDPMEPGTQGRAGSFRGFSGKDGSPLFVMWGNGGGFGVIGDVLGDVNGDRVPDLVVGAPGASRGGQVVGKAMVRSLVPVAPMGKGCSVGAAPRLDSTTPVVGASCQLFLAGAPRQNGILFMAAVPAVPTPLGGGCFLHLDVAQSVCLGSFATDASGRWTRSVAVPNVMALRGAEFAIQCAVGATGAPLGTDLSNGVSLVVQ